MRVMWLSHFICEDTPLYGGKFGVHIRIEKSITLGNSCNSFFFCLPNHCSTHIDLPYHFLSNGRRLEDFEADEWIFRNVVLVELNGVCPCEIIDWKRLENLLPNRKDTDLVLLKTGFEAYRGTSVYWERSPGLSPDLAFYLREMYPNLRAIGVDIISISSLCDRDLGRLAHREFLSREILLIEDMRLSDLYIAPDMVIVLPLLMKGVDASPVSALAVWEG